MSHTTVIPPRPSAENTEKAENTRNPKNRPVPEFAGLPEPARRTVVRTRQLLARYSVDALRISLGLVFLGFGALKFFPGASPAEDLAIRTIDTLSFGIVSGGSALLLTAILETFVGLTFLTGKFLKTGLVVLGGALVGILSPLVLFTTDLFPGGLPTLEAQYVVKDIILAAAGLVVAAKALGARYLVHS